MTSSSMTSMSMSMGRRGARRATATGRGGREVAYALVIVANAIMHGVKGQEVFRKLHAWGENKHGELGLGEGQALSSCTDSEIVELGWDLEGTLTSVSASLNHAVALTAEGAVYAWGNNQCGQLGLGDVKNRYKPTQIDALIGVPITQVAVGVEHTLALSKDGRLYAFGCDGRGSLGLGSSTVGNVTESKAVSKPTVVSTPESFVKIAAGALHSVGLSGSGSVYTWGANDQGQLGLGGCRKPGGPENDPCLDDVFVPTKVTSTSASGTLPSIKLIAAGGGQVGTGSRHLSQGGHTLAVTTTNEVYAWGDNFHGQLGVKQTYTLIPGTSSYTPNTYDETTGLYYNRQELPTQTESFSIDAGANTFLESGKSEVPEITQIEAGAFHSLILTDTGEIFAWGDNYYGQLGLGYVSYNSEPTQYYATQNYSQPEMVDRPTRIKKFDYTSVGADNNTYTHTGKISGENATFTQIAAGGYNSMAITSNNKLFVWGINAEGQLGTCGCGGCAKYGAADPGTCTINSTATCECSCSGTGTCHYVAASVSNQFVAANRGTCNGTKAECMCEGIMTGKIDIMDEPMMSDLHLSPNAFTDAVHASAGGGGIYAITESLCKDDADGVVCSGAGTCQADGTCACSAGTGGDTCQNVCPQATDTDERMLKNLGVVNDAISGKDCAGHGVCDAYTALCACERGYYGPSCALVCPVDTLGRTCSGNGTCVYNTGVSSMPYCLCDRSQDPVWCGARGIKIHSQGWCSYHGGDEYGGFDACYLTGECGSCQSPGARATMTFALAFVLACVVLLIHR